MTAFAAPLRKGTSASRLGLAGIAIMSVALLTSCFTTATDFRDKAEAFIETEVAEAEAVDLASVVCETPVDRNDGTQFECSAIDGAGGVWKFTVSIEGTSSIAVGILDRP